MAWSSSCRSNALIKVKFILTSIQRFGNTLGYIYVCGRNHALYRVRTLTYNTITL